MDVFSLNLFIFEKKELLKLLCQKCFVDFMFVSSTKTSQHVFCVNDNGPTKVCANCSKWPDQLLSAAHYLVTIILVKLFGILI